jgi:hypothetical protein
MTVQEMVRVLLNKLSQIVAVAVAVATILVVFASLRTTWYHEIHVTAFLSQGFENRDEIQYSLDGQFFVDGNDRDFWSFEGGTEFWNPREPIHSFTERLQILLTVGATLSGLWALLVLLERRRLSLVAGVSSAGLFGASALIFYLWFGAIYTASDLPGTHEEFTKFFLSVSEETSYGVSYADIWGPMTGWWLVVIALATQVFGMFVLAILRRKKSRTVRGTRPSLSPSGQP